MRKAFDACVLGMLVMGAVCATARAADPGLERLGEAFVAGLKDQDMVQVAQCWMSARRIEELLESYKIDAPDILAEVEEIGVAEEWKERDSEIITNVGALIALLEEGDYDTSEMELLEIEAEARQETAHPELLFAPMMRLRIKVDERTELKYTIYSALAVAGEWYFTGRPDDPVEITTDGETRAIVLIGKGTGVVPTLNDECLSTLRQMGLGLQMYAMDNNDVLPESLGLLADQGYISRETLLCPSDSSPMTIAGAEGEYECSYYCVGQLSMLEALTKADSGRFVVAYEKAGNHPEGRSCLYTDGHVAMLREGELIEALGYSLRSLRQASGWKWLPDERKVELEEFYAGHPAGGEEAPSE